MSEDVILLVFHLNLKLLFIMWGQPMAQLNNSFLCGSKLAVFHSSLASFMTLLQSLLSFDVISGYLQLYPRLVGVTSCMYLEATKK